MRNSLKFSCELEVWLKTSIVRGVRVDGAHIVHIAVVPSVRSDCWGIRKTNCGLI